MTDDVDPITVYDVPRCSKCREVLALIADEAPGVPINRIEFHETGLTQDGLRELLHVAGLEPRDVLRTRESLVAELDLPGERTDDELIELIVEHPRLLQRPLVVRGDRALLARPVERVRELYA